MKYSIIIVSYNSDEYLKRCLDSIVNQTVKNFKVIFVDDGSTDDTKKIVKSYQKKHKYIEYYYKENGGTAHSRNYGIAKVDTPYFLFVDADDYIANDLMETVEKYDNYDILSFKAFEVNNNGDILKKREKIDFRMVDGQSFLKLSFYNQSDFVVPWSYVYKTDFWLEHKLEYPNGYVLEDTSGTPIALINAEIMTSIDYYGYYYVQTTESTFRTKNKEKINRNTTSYLFHYDHMADYIKHFECDENFRKTFLYYISEVILWYGTTLPFSHLKSFDKELKKRDVASNLINWGKYMERKIKLCRFSYTLYCLTSRFKKFLDPKWVYWNIINKIFWRIRNFFVKIYWNIINKNYWRLKKVYWKLSSKNKEK